MPVCGCLYVATCRDRHQWWLVGRVAVAGSRVAKPRGENRYERVTAAPGHVLVYS